MTVSVRYIVNDVDASVDFYTRLLGFERGTQGGAPGGPSGFASLTRGDLRLLINRPGAGGAGQSMPDGRAPQPGGWNRIIVEVDDLDAKVAGIRAAGGAFRNEIVTGNGGKQILLDDPSGNAIELLEPFATA